MLKQNNIIIDDEYLAFLAESYIKLKKNPTYKSLSSTFQLYISEFLDEELKKIKLNKGG